jgi:hypothetical protein
MPAFSEQNFGNDGARDYLKMITSRFLATISEVFSNPDRLQLDEDGESMFMPSIEILALLCERYGAPPPRQATVRQWHSRYLQVYDEGIDNLEVSPEFKAHRRKVIDCTFRWLEGLSESHWSP